VKTEAASSFSEMNWPGLYSFLMLPALISFSASGSESTKMALGECLPLPLSEKNGSQLCSSSLS